MIVNVLAGCAWMLLADAGHGAPTPARLAPAQSLDGDGWRIATDDKNQGREAHWYAAPRPEAKPTGVPTALQEAFPDYHGLVWYWKTFDAPRSPDPQGRYLLRFHSVDYKLNRARTALGLYGVLSRAAVASRPRFPPLRAGCRPSGRNCVRCR